MNLKEAISEIEKRYKQGDEIYCLFMQRDKFIYNGWKDLVAIDASDKEVYIQNDTRTIKIMSGGIWAEAFREKKSLWGFFESVKDEYPNLAEEYLRECGQNQSEKRKAFGVSFTWKGSKSGSVYWDRISDLSEAYFKED